MFRDAMLHWREVTLRKVCLILLTNMLLKFFIPAYLIMLVCVSQFPVLCQLAEPDGADKRASIGGTGASRTHSGSVGQTCVCVCLCVCVDVSWLVWLCLFISHFLAVHFIVKLSQVFRHWQRRTQNCIDDREKCEQADRLRGRTVVRKCFSAWRNYHHTSLKKKVGSFKAFTLESNHQ